MELSEVSSKYGAPMGRSEVVMNHGATGLKFELEWVPMVDGDYDYGGAYWGGGRGTEPLYCAKADGEDIVITMFVRARTRADAMSKVLEMYPESTFEPENGSLIKATIKSLNKHLEDNQDCMQSVEEDISDLEGILEEKGIDHD